MLMEREAEEILTQTLQKPKGSVEAMLKTYILIIHEILKMLADF